MRQRRTASQPPPTLRLPPAQPGPPKSWHPYPFDVADAQAVQAMVRGQANSDQQMRVLALLINGVCGTYDLSYRPDGDRDTAFAEGKRFVGLQLVKLTAVNISELERVERERKR
jgi:hypothetical protein